MRMFKCKGISVAKYCEMMNDWTKLDHVRSAVEVYQNLLKLKTPGERMHTHYTKRLKLSEADLDKELANGNISIPS